jgi:hypothetical protein
MTFVKLNDINKMLLSLHYNTTYYNTSRLGFPVPRLIKAFAETCPFSATRGNIAVALLHAYVHHVILRPASSIINNCVVL